MALKLTADPDTRVITITEAPVGGFQSLDVVTDVFSPLKDDWRDTASLQALRFPFRTFGDPKSATEQIGPYVFFNNIDGWRFEPFDSDHELTFVGNLVPESAVQGTLVPTYLARTGRTIPILLEQSAQALTVGGSAVTPTTVLETGVTWEEAMRLMLASLAANLSGAETATVTIRDVNNTKNRIVANVDANGNRTITFLDGT